MILYEVQQSELSQECLLWDTCCRIHVHLTTGSHAAPIRADNGNLGKFGVTFQYGTVFAPKESLYEGSYGYEEPKKLILESEQIG